MIKKFVAIQLGPNYRRATEFVAMCTDVVEAAVLSSKPRQAVDVRANEIVADEILAPVSSHWSLPI